MTIILSGLQFRCHQLHCDSITREQLATDDHTPLYEYSAESMYTNTTGAEELFIEKMANDRLALYKLYETATPSSTDDTN